MVDGCVESQHKPLPVLSYSLAHPSSLLNTVKLAIALLHVHSANHLSFQPVSLIWVINYSRIAKFAEKQGHLFQSVLSTFLCWKLIGCFICQWFRTELYFWVVFSFNLKTCFEIISIHIEIMRCEYNLTHKGTNTFSVDLFHTWEWIKRWPILVSCINLLNAVKYIIYLVLYSTVSHLCC